jgi:hypothetical protein
VALLFPAWKKDREIFHAESSGFTMRFHAGLALIFVVGVLAVMLVLGVAFAQSAGLEFRAAVSVRDLEEASAAADTGLHQAIAFLQHDAWGVNEKSAFVCAESRGALHQENGADFVPGETLSGMDGSVAFFLRAPKGFQRITRQAAKWRRPLSRVPINPGSEQAQDHPIPSSPPRDGQAGVRVVENDLSWVVNDSASYKRGGAPVDLAGLDGFEAGTPEAGRIPVQSGAPMHDEFLPGPLDNSDCWELRTHLNRALPRGARHFGGRDTGNDFRATGGAWTDGGWRGHYWAWPAMRPFEEFDYIDTRLCGDAFYRLFRSDLIADPASDAGGLSFESGVDPQSVERSGVSSFSAFSPQRYLHDKSDAAWIHPKNAQRRLRYTHMGRVSGNYTDTRGNAININQVNNNAVSERFVDAEGKVYFYNEAKWIYIHQPDGSHGATLKRYAVTIVAESGLPNANFSGPPAEELQPPLDESARTWGLEWYLQAVDAGFSPRGSPLSAGFLNELKAPGDSAWARHAAQRLNSHIRGFGPITSRAELNMVLRKEVFNTTNAGETPERQRAVDYLADQLSVHAYEYQLDQHWSADRLIIDRGNTASHASSALAEEAPNGAASQATRRRLAELLDQLRFSYGPDERRENGEAWTPYHLSTTDDAPSRTQARWSKAGSIAWLLSASLDCGEVCEWGPSGHPEWWKQSDGKTERELRVRMSDHKPDHAVGIKADTWEYKDRVNANDLAYQQETGWVGAHGWSPRISEVGRVLPRAFTELAPIPKGEAVYALPETAGKNAWKFDGKKEYWFVELAANVSEPAAPLRQRLMDDYAGNWKRHWQLLVRNPSGGNTDIMQLPGTRLICVDFAADPASEKNFGGDAMSEDPRRELCGMNRIKVFDPAVLSSGDNTVDGRTMTRPAVATLNHWTWRWRPDMPKPLTLRDVSGEADGSSRCEVPWRDSFARAHPANYMLALFDPAELPKDTTGRQLRWCCRRLGSLTESIVLDAVDFPEDSKPFEEGWEAVDPRGHRDGRLGWRRARAFGPPDGNACAPREGRPPHAPLARLECEGVMQGAFKMFTGSPAFRFMTRGEGLYYNWCDGLNEQAIGHFAPGGEKNWSAGNQRFTRDDVEGRTGARSWPHAAANENSARMETYGSSRGLLQFSCDMEKVPLGWLSLTDSATGDGGLVPDADLRNWGDLQRVTPLEQQITFGYLRGNAWGRPLTEDMFWLYPACDGLDNNLDGRIDPLTTVPLFSGNAEGRCQSDRKVAGRVNLNEITNPAVLWYAGLGVPPDAEGRRPAQNLMTALGRKPAKGYLSWREIFTRLNLQSREDTPYNALIWPDNLFADLSADHAHAGEQYDNLSRKKMSVARTVTTSHSTVYTIFCTAQTIDRQGMVRGQVRTRTTVERTAEGRVNILECAPIKEP